jgi:hypothetical protein
MAQALLAEIQPELVALAAVGTVRLLQLVRLEVPTLVEALAVVAVELLGEILTAQQAAQES